MTWDELQPYGILLDGVPALMPPWGEYNQWKVPESFRYVSNEGLTITIPNNFMTDLASIPRILRIFFGSNHREAVAAVIHDHLYGSHKEKLHNCIFKKDEHYSRKEADGILYDVMCMAGVHWTRRHTIYWGVRAFGWIAWLRCTGDGLVKGVEL